MINNHLSVSPELLSKNWTHNLAFAISFKYIFRKTLLKPYVQGFSIRNVYCTKISKEIDSKSETKMTSVQSILRGMKYMISISESISEMQHDTLI